MTSVRQAVVIGTQPHGVLAMIQADEPRWGFSAIQWFYL